MISPIQTALADLRAGKTSATRLVQASLDKIKASPLNAFITVTEEQALAEATALDQSGDYSLPLAGIPVGIKDIICTKGVKTTAASKILKDFVPPYSATVYEKLKKAGAIMVGKTNCDEFAMGSSTENSAFGLTKNPHDPQRVPGGSSGGSAAAVAGDECLLALGTDTGGSIRQPANYCGCVGLKVTYGRVSRSGVIAYASSFDTIGPLTRCVEDAAAVLNVIAGPDPKDATTPPEPVNDYTANLKADITGKVIGLPKEYFEAAGFDPRIKAACERAAKLLEARGAKLKEISLPLTEYAIPTYYLLVKAEASTNLARYDGIRFGETAEGKTLEEIYEKTRGEHFGDEVKRAIMMGTFTLSSGYVDAYYKKAAAVRALIKKDYDNAFAEVDTILAPVSPVLPFRIGERIGDPLQMYLVDIFSVPVNIAGIPALAVPTEKLDGLPTGVQLLGRQFDEAGILNIGWHLEEGAGYF
jgi:aspartyl-tRNA(Asn)/glutamyl-tRNA(Gln) amidotransferase subunit A